MPKQLPYIPDSDPSASSAADSADSAGVSAIGDGTALVQIETTPGALSGANPTGESPARTDAPKPLASGVAPGATPLASVFERKQGTKGPTLTYSTEVPRSRLGHPEGTAVEVPRRLESENGQVFERIKSPHDHGDIVVIRPPAGLQSSAQMRLRGLGALGDGDHPGDLLLTVRPADIDALAIPGEPKTFPWTWVGVAAAVAALIVLMLL